MLMTFLTTAQKATSTHRRVKNLIIPSLRNKRIKFEKYFFAKANNFAQRISITYLYFQLKYSKHSFRDEKIFHSVTFFDMDVATNPTRCAFRSTYTYKYTKSSNKENFHLLRTIRNVIHEKYSNLKTSKPNLIMRITMDSCSHSHKRRYIRYRDTYEYVFFFAVDFPLFLFSYFDLLLGKNSQPLWFTYSSFTSERFFFSTSPPTCFLFPNIGIYFSSCIMRRFR